jgi:hypothetical protein
MYRSSFLDLDNSRRRVVSFTRRLLYLRERSPRYQLDRRLGGPQSRSERRGEEKFIDPTGTRTPTPPSSSPFPVAIPCTGCIEHKKVKKYMQNLCKETSWHYCPTKARWRLYSNTFRLINNISVKEGNFYVSQFPLSFSWLLRAW